MVFLAITKFSNFFFQAAFDWPLGQIGKIKQKYQKSKSTKRSKSDAHLAESANARNLKRRGSERHGKSRKVAFEDQQAVPWWNYPMKLMKNATLSASTGNLKKKRTRHNTDPESSKISLGALLAAPEASIWTFSGSRIRIKTYADPKHWL